MRMSNKQKKSQNDKKCKKIKKCIILTWFNIGCTIVSVNFNMGTKLACICANEAVNESPHSDNIRIATDGLTSLLKSNAFCTSFGIFGMVIDAVKINFDVKRKK